MYEENECCYHPVTRPPPNPIIRNRKTSKEHMQSHRNSLTSVKQNPKQKGVSTKKLLLHPSSSQQPSADGYSLERSVSWNNLHNASLQDAPQRSLSASNLYAVHDPNLSLKRAIVEKSYDKPNTSYANEKAEFVAWSQKYFYQLTEGCGNSNCGNAFCRSSKKMNFKPALSALLATELSKLKGQCLCENSMQKAKLFQKEIFEEKIASATENVSPFLYKFYLTSPFRSLFLPSPMTSSGLGLCRTHSANDLTSLTDQKGGVASRLKDRLCSIASTLSASLSSLLQATSPQNDNPSTPKKREVIKKQVSFDSTDEHSPIEHKTIVTRKRLPSVRIFDDQHAVDIDGENHDVIDDFESQVAQEFTTARSPRRKIEKHVSLEEDLASGEYSLTHLTLEMFTIVAENFELCQDDSLLSNTLRTVFSSWDSLKLSFYNESLKGNCVQTPFNLKLDDVQTMFEKLSNLDNSDHFMTILCNAVKLALIERKGRITDASDLKPIAILLEIPCFSKDYSLVQETANLVSRLPSSCKQVLSVYIASIVPEKFKSLVDGFLSQLSSDTPWNSPPLKDNLNLCALCTTLEVFYCANTMNGDHHSVISRDSFYCNEMAAKIDFKQEYIYWKKILAGKYGKQQSILDYPFLLDPGVKVQVMHIDAITQMREEYQDAIVHQARVQQVQKSWSDFSDSSALSTDVRSAMCPYLLLEIRRDHFIEDTLKHLQQKSGDLKKPLKIKYTAGGEQGLDMGGLQKEFFQVVVETMFNPSYSLFSMSEDGNLAWFNAFSLEPNVMFELVGILLGLAIYNGIILDVHFPMLVYKKLLDHPLTIEDLQEIQPTVANGLKQLLRYEGDVENDFCLTFEASHSIYGRNEKSALVEGGENMVVTNENRELFVERYVAYILEESVHRQFNAFKKGFFQVCNGPTVRLFAPPELELLICGSPQLDFKGLEKVTEYKDGYTRHHPLIIDFWSIVHEFNLKEKQSLLMFVTGSFRVPLKGLSSMSFFIQRNGPDSNNLPTSMTCFNRLLLPEYKGAEKLKRMLLLAIENSKGFGLT